MIEKTTFKMTEYCEFPMFYKKNVVVFHNSPNHKKYTAFYEFF